MKTVFYPIESDLFEAVRAYLAELVVERKGDRVGSKVFVGVIKKQNKVPRRDILKEWEERMSNAFTLTITQDHQDDRKVREFFASLMQTIDVNWHADELKPDTPSNIFPLYICIRHERFDSRHGGGFVLSYFISMDSTTMEVAQDRIEVCRDEIYDDLDALVMRYEYLP